MRAIGGTAVAAQAVTSDAGTAAKKKKKKAKAIPGPAGPQGPAGPTGPQGPAGSNANLTGITTTQSANIPVANNASTGGSVDCPAGQIALSGGANIQALPVGASLSASRLQDSNTWTASVNNQSGGSVNLQVFVNCIAP